MRKKVSGWVYLIKYPANNYKIGCSQNPTKRLRQLQRNSPSRLYLYHQIKSQNMYELERELLARFGLKKNKRGEYFYLSDDEVENFCLSQN